MLIRSSDDKLNWIEWYLQTHGQAFLADADPIAMLSFSIRWDGIPPFAVVGLIEARCRMRGLLPDHVESLRSWGEAYRPDDSYAAVCSRLLDRIIDDLQVADGGKKRKPRKRGKKK